MDRDMYRQPIPPPGYAALPWRFMPPYYPMLAPYYPMMAPYFPLTNNAYMESVRYVYQIYEAEAAAAATEGEARAVAEAPLIRFSPPSVEALDQEVAVPVSASGSASHRFHRRIVMDFAGQQALQDAPGDAHSQRGSSPERPLNLPLRDWTSTYLSLPAVPPSPASSGSPDIVPVTPPTVLDVSPTPLPQFLNRHFEPRVTRFSEPSTSGSRLSQVRRSVKPHSQNLPRPCPVSTPLNYPMPPPAHTPAPLRTHLPMPPTAHTPMPPPAHTPMPPPVHSPMPPPAHSPMPLRTPLLKRHRTHSPKHLPVHSAMPLPGQSSLPFRAHLSVPPPAHSPMPLRTPSPKRHREHSPKRHREHSPMHLPVQLPMPTSAHSSLPFRARSPVPYPPELLEMIPLPPARCTQPASTNVRPWTLTPELPRIPAEWHPTAPTDMRSAAPTPINSTAPALHYSAYIPYPSSPMPVIRTTPAPARHQSAYVDQDSPPQYRTIHRGMHGHTPERRTLAPSESSATRMNRLRGINRENKRQ